MTKRHLFALLLMPWLVACSGAESPTSDPESARRTEMSPLQHGAKIYTRCRACHTLEAEGRHKVGPNLWGIYGSTTGSKEGFAYSKAMKASDVVWTEETMDAYLRKPSEFMPGNRMTFIGLKKQEDRDAVQLYLRHKTTPSADQ